MSETSGGFARDQLAVKVIHIQHRVSLGPRFLTRFGVCLRPFLIAPCLRSAPAEPAP